MGEHLGSSGIRLLAGVSLFTLGACGIAQASPSENRSYDVEQVGANILQIKGRGFWSSEYNGAALDGLFDISQQCTLTGIDSSKPGRLKIYTEEVDPLTTCYSPVHEPVTRTRTVYQHADYEIIQAGRGFLNVTSNSINRALSEIAKRCKIISGSGSLIVTKESTCNLNTP